MVGPPQVWGPQRRRTAAAHLQQLLLHRQAKYWGQGLYIHPNTDAAAAALAAADAAAAAVGSAADKRS